MTQFYAKGCKVFKAAEERTEDGKKLITLGFPILEICDHINNGDAIAQHVATALNAYEPPPPNKEAA